MTTVALGVSPSCSASSSEAEHRLHGRPGLLHRRQLIPVLLLSMYWKKLTTRGAMIGGWMGLITAVGLMSSARPLGADPRPRESHLPVRVPGAVLDDRRFVGIWFFSITDKSAAADEERARFFRSSSVPRPAWAPLARWPAKRYVKA
ncbi:hypothetical protein P4131_03740 [Pseudomonas aeruginosa]|nr:hypothetical protein [Pseudomonas aeruginosa]